MTEHDALKLSRRTLVKAGAPPPRPPFAGSARSAASPHRTSPRFLGKDTHPSLGGQAGRYVDHELWNGYPVGSNHQNGPGLLHEPLAFYSAFADKTIPWLAES